MEVICYFEEGPVAEDIKLIVEEVVLNEALSVGVDPGKIEKVGISSSENYPHAMPDLFGNIAYTQNAEHTVAGKAVSSLSDSDGLRHRLMLVDYVAEGLISTQVQVEKTDEQLFLERSASHILSHELGHCKDHELRPSSLTLSGSLNFPEGFDLNLINDYYYPILLSEFAACFHGRSYTHRDQIHDQVKADQETFGAKIAEIESIKDAQEDGFIADVAFHSSQVIWLYLIQYTKIWTSKLGTQWEEDTIPSLSSISYDHELVDEFLSELAAKYPADPDFLENMSEIWEDLSSTMGYRFRHESLGWSCRWRTI
ncbi:hypothetical protein OAF99_02855 [Akkermansiaceae bacterium]|nr:hypothetical protein [Akkermansiaceae bacterium]